MGTQKSKVRARSTATTTYDGRTVVDARKLLERAHVKEFMQRVSAKVQRNGHKEEVYSVGEVEGQPASR